MTWPQSKGLAEGLHKCDSLLLGRADGSIAIIEVSNDGSIRRLELEHCYRKGWRLFVIFGVYYLYLSIKGLLVIGAGLQIEIILILCC